MAIAVSGFPRRIPGCQRPPAERSASWRSRSWRRTAAPTAAATKPRVSTAPLHGQPWRLPSGHPLRQGDAEDAPFIDALGQLAETGGLDQLVHLRLAAPAHDPGFAATVAGQRAGDQFQLRVPRLPG